MRASFLAGVSVVLAAGIVANPVTPAEAAVACSVRYQKSWDNGGGFGANLTIRNLGDPLDGWTLAFAFAGNQRVTQRWPVTWSQSGSQVTAASNAPWNAVLGTGAELGIGFNGAYSGVNADPTAFTINGTVCNGGGGGNLSPVVSLTSPVSGESFPAGATVPLAATASDPDGSIGRVEFRVDGTLVNTDASAPYSFSVAGLTAGGHTAQAVAFDNGSPQGSASTPAVPFTIGTGGGGSKVDNPFAGATGYLNADWRAQVNAAADAAGGTLGARMRTVGQQPTAVWMDRIGAISPATGLGLAAHLDAAVQQDAANGAVPVVIQVVIYDLPNRDCAALASNGELLIAQNGLARYRAEYIDPIRSILARPAYVNLRLALIIEPDSLPNLVTNVSGPQASARCIEAQQTGAYRDGVRYAVSQLSTLSNTYLYLDIAHSGWLGWPNNFDGALNVFDQVLAAGQGGPGYGAIHGFITNTANYTPLEEIFLPNPQLQVGGQQVMSATFYEFNPRFDERDFAVGLQTAFAARGCTGCGMLVDTSRNGWGGAGRPSGVSTSTDLNTYVSQSRLDRRPHRGGWCNQNGAGIGLRPTANTGIAGLDAFVWVKPPGESDGVSQPGVVDPTDPNKGFDAMCDPTAQNRYNTAFPTNALPGAPHAGRWFPAQFTMLVQNAYPPL